MDVLEIAKREETRPLSKWVGAGANELSADSLERLFANEIPYIRIPDFATRDECEHLVAEAGQHGFNAYRNVEPRIDKLGITVFEYNAISKRRYFEDARTARQIQEAIFQRSFDPIARLRGLIEARTAYHARVARTEAGADYFAGLVRRIEKGTLIHVDFAPAEQEGWCVGQVTHQLAWNLYLRTSGNGGKTHVFQRQWNPEHERYKDGSYGYDPAVSQGSEKAAFEPRPGEVVLFNTRNFHYVDPTADERITVTSALGRLSDRELIFWS